MNRTSPFWRNCNESFITLGKRRKGVVSTGGVTFVSFLEKLGYSAAHSRQEKKTGSLSCGGVVATHSFEERVFSPKETMTLCFEERVRSDSFGDEFHSFSLREFKIPISNNL